MIQPPLPSANIFSINIEPGRIENSQPVSFRLLQKKDGPLVLQGAIRWAQGSDGGIEWRDLPTVIEA